MKEFPNQHPTSDHLRLTTLFSISKKLSVFSRVEESFADILECVSECFPLSSAVLIEHWEQRPHTAIWFAENTSKELVAKAIEHAKSAYSYLSGASIGQETDLINGLTPEKVLVRNDKTLLFNKSDNGNFIVIPLVIDDLPPLGALQLEGPASLDEKDLEFVIALANLVSVALDRYYKTKRDRAIQEEEARRSLKTLFQSQDKIHNLESERDLREAFVTLLTHDLRTPLTIILGSAQMILRRPDNIETTIKSARLIFNHANRAGQMITDLLDANRIRSGEGLHINKEEINLTELIKNSLTELSIIHGDRFIFLETVQVLCPVDVKGIRRVIENLCSNAIKYGSTTTPVTVKLEQTKTHNLISVCNQGSVISAEDKKSLFLQFRRSEAVSVSSKKGWGIGLALVEGVAEAHGGSVAVESDLINGTVFTVILPKDSP